MATFEITSAIAQSIIALNEPEYIQWADGSQITVKELEGDFHLQVLGNLDFIPKFDLVHKNEDYTLNNIYAVASDDKIGVHFNDMRMPTKIQYSWNGILLSENNADMNDLEDIKELSGQDIAMYSDIEGLYAYTFYVTKCELASPF